jgi:two-component system sensor histidine kinase YesM
MSSSLINLLKYNLSSSTVATLGEEVESVRNYVGIQKYRFGDVFEFKTEIEKGTEKCIISRFVLQPLVENCLIHGLENMESGGKILVRSSVDGESLHLAVINNGSGMDKETLEKVNQGTTPQNKSSSNIGVNNIRERLKLQFGDKATLVYSFEPGLGTVVILRFPLSVKNGA